jgi:hypothetical protein
MRLSFDATSDGHFTAADVKALIDACVHLGMPLAATKLSGKTKLTGSGPLKTLTAEWDEHTANPSTTMAPASTQLVPGLDDRPTTPIVVPPSASG